MEFELVWFDSLGAKSSCVLVKCDVNILIDPGVAIMHPGFPASKAKKILWYEKARRKVRQASKNADMVVISHYHYDHFTDFDKKIYENKIVFAKDPNKYINDSQRKRAERFFGNFCREFRGRHLKEILERPSKMEFGNPLEKLEIARNKNFGDYQRRREELLKKGERWFFERAKKWNRYPKIPEMEFGRTKVKFAEGRKFTFGKTRIKFSKPMFHGIEFSRVGWVFSTVIEYKGKKLIHSSDLNGPVIEDYAEWIIKENPDILILDGPMTYMLGYTLNMINFRRCIENMLRIIKEADISLIIYDHHLPREPKFRERTREVWETAKRLGRKVLTAAEFLGKRPVVLESEKG